MRAVCFGELMMRLNPEGYKRIRQAESFCASYAGGEGNVAVSLANYGVDAAYVTKVPEHEVGQSAVDSMRRYGVDTKYMLRGGPRLGIYFVEKGASQRPSKVIYDRANSSIALADPAEFDWAEIFKGADWFHFTGITPALGDNMAKACLDAVCKAPSAVNEQPVVFAQDASDAPVRAELVRVKSGMEYTDLGIAKYHFETVARACGVDGSWQWGDGAPFDVPV